MPRDKAFLLAKEHYLRAGQLLDAVHVEPGNHYNGVKNLRLALQLIEGFNVNPPDWKITAVRLLDDSESSLKKKLDELEKAALQYEQIGTANSLQKAKDTWRQIIDHVPDRSNSWYKKATKFLGKIDVKIRKLNR